MQELYERKSDRSLLHESLLWVVPLLRQITYVKRIEQNLRLADRLREAAKYHEIPKDGHFYLLGATQDYNFVARALKWDDDKPSVLLIFIGSMIDRYREALYRVDESGLCWRQAIDLRHDRQTSHTDICGIDVEAKIADPSQMQQLINEVTISETLDNNGQIDPEVSEMIHRFRGLFRSEARQIPWGGAYKWPEVRVSV